MPIGDQIKAVGRGFVPAARQNILWIVAFAGITAAIAAARWTSNAHALTSGRNIVIAAGVGLGGGFLIGFVPVIGGGSSSFAKKVSDSQENLNWAGKTFTQLAIVAVGGMVLGYAPVIAIGIFGGLLGNHLMHTAREKGSVGAAGAAPLSGWRGRSDVGEGHQLGRA